MATDAWSDLVSSRVGIVRRLRPQPRGGDEPEPPYLFTAELSNYDFRVATRAERLAAGKGWTAVEAQAAAVGEAVERYCAHHWDPRRTIVARRDALTVPAIDPAACVLYSAEQYARPDWPFEPWREETEVTWIVGAGIADGEPVALPAGLVYLTFPPPRPEDAFALATSNGLAAGRTVAAAALGALCEVMERDALMIAWLNRLPATELLLDRDAGIAGSLARHYALLGVTLRAFALPTDLPATVVMAIAFEDAAGAPAAVVGMGCHPSPHTALTKAAFELCQARPAEAARHRERPPEGRLRAYEDVQSLDDHSAFAALAERRGELAFLWSSGRTARVADLDDPATGDVEADLRRCAAALDAAGHRAAQVELTTEDVAACGYHVVRVVAAGLQPIHFGFGQERLGGTRLFTLPQRLGLAAAPRTVDDLNPCPHPMA